jgi:Transglycosylase SLT domain
VKRSWMMSLGLCWLWVGLVSAQPVAPVKTKVTKAVVRLMTRAESYEPHFIAAAHRYGLDPRLLWVVAYLETRFNPLAISPKGARGMMQFMPATAARYGLRDPHEPTDAIDAAARYLRDLLRRYGQRVDLALAAYNAGETAVDAALQKNGSGIPPYRETQSYVRRGLQLLEDRPAMMTMPKKDELPAKSQQVAEVVVVAQPAVPRGLTRQSVYSHVESPQQAKRVRRSVYFGPQH